MLPMICTIESPEDREQMTLFYEKYHLLIFKEARKYWDRNEDVEDVVHETFARLIDKMETFRTLQRKQQIHYALVTVRNLSLTLLVRAQKLPTVSLDSFYTFPIEETDDLAERMDKDILSLQIRKIWNDLPVQDKMILEQKYYLQWSNDAIAKTLNIQPQSVRMYLTRAKRNLVRELNENDIHWLNR